MALAMKGNVVSSRAFPQRCAKAPFNKAAVRQLVPKGRGVLQIVAYREGHSVETTTHRCETVNAVGREMVDAWFNGVKKGAEVTSEAMKQYISPDVEFRRNQGLEMVKGKGVEFVRQQLNKEAELYDLHDYRIVASAASDQDDTFFALVEYKYTSKAAPDAGECVGYKVLEIDVMLDDGAKMVECIYERGQLSPEDVPQGAAALCHPNVFPVDRLSSFPSGVKSSKVVENARAWCKARSSGESEDLLDGVMDPSFKLYDAYGLLPSLVGPEHSAKAEAALVPYDKVKELVRQSKSRYNVDCHLVDSAVCSKSNVGFSHWRSHFKGGDKEFSLEGIEVEIFNQEGKFTDIWLFRDPMDFEREMLENKA